MQRKINFNAGPATLPMEVLQEAAAAVTEYNGTGMSILELPHRGKEFVAIVEESKAIVKDLCELGDDYEVLWLHGGGRQQFFMLPMNFLDKEHDDAAGYIDSGHWSEEALEYATHYGDVQVLTSSKESNYSVLPAWPHTVPAQLKYVHFTSNNTIYGTQFRNIPKCNVPLVADMSSDIFCGRMNYTNCAIFYAAVQKNLGTPGVALVAIRKDMLAMCNKELPPMLSYAAQARENSILNTANVFGIYTSLLMLRWTQKKGIDAIEKENKEKANLLYDTIDKSKVFTGVVKKKADRSMMNVCFTADSEEREKDFLKLCADNNIIGVKGHRSVGGFRVSLYNAMGLDDVTVLCDLMKTFEKI